MQTPSFMTPVNLQRKKDPLSTQQHTFFPPAPGIVQTKLTVNAPGDEYEQEANAMADKVMTMPAAGTVQRKCAACEQEDKVHRKEDGPPVNDHLAASLDSTKGGGQPLQDDVKGYMEPRFGTDFSGVKVHTDASAVQLSRDLNAQAFTHGSDIYFNEGKFSPGTTEGKHLLAHELTHVVQQNAQ